MRQYVSAQHRPYESVATTTLRPRAKRALHANTSYVLQTVSPLPCNTQRVRQPAPLLRPAHSPLSLASSSGGMEERSQPRHASSLAGAIR